MSDDPAIEDRITDPTFASSRDYRVNKLSFESLLASFASTFITLGGDDVDTEIEHWMGRILEYLDLDRSTVIQSAATDETPRFTHVCARQGIIPLRKTVVEDDFPWLTSQLSKGEMVVFSSLDELPPEAADDRNSIERRGARSMAAIPFITQGEYFGALIFTTINRERAWSQETIQHLHLTGQIFASVLLRKRAEIAALQTRQRLLAITRIASDIIVDFHVESGLLNWLGDIDRLLGYRPGEFPRHLDGWKETIHPDDREETVAYVERCIETGEEANFCYRIRCHDGSYRNWEVCAAAVEWNDDGKPTRWAAVSTDVTARLSAEEDAAKLRDQLLHVSRISTLGELTTTLAHEINQPLAAILNNAQAALRLLKQSEPDLEEARAALEDVVADDQRAADVILHLRSFLKKHDFTPTPLSINELVEQVLSLVKGEIARRRVRIKLDLAKDIPTASGDRFRLQQVILNLVMNSLEAMADTNVFRKVLRIETSRLSDDLIEVSISDTGKGITDLNIDDLFDPFFTTKSEGMGMGLAICKSIIEGHGGQLQGLTNADLGATFQFTLPLESNSS